MYIIINIIINIINIIIMYYLAHTLTHIWILLSSGVWWLHDSENSLLSWYVAHSTLVH